MQYGFFDDGKREYVITRPDTPWPWINYLGNHDFYSLVSNTAGGYSFYKDARLRRITRYRYNNVPMDVGGKYFYINDNGNVWSPGWKPVKANLDENSCRHGLGYTIIRGVKGGLEAEVTYFVPLHFKGEVQRLRLKNHSNKPRSFKLFSFVEWCLWNAHDDMTNFQRNFSTGEVEIDDSVLYHKTEYKERRNHFAFYSVNAPIQGYDTDRETFFGLHNGFHEPKTVLIGKPGNTEAHGWSPIASHYMEIMLHPGEVREFNFLLGYVELPDDQKWSSPGIINKKEARLMIEQFATPLQIDLALESLKNYWDKLLGVYQLTDSEEKLKRMVNIWNPYQCMITYNFSRSASFFESGIGRGMGFRDSNQDLIGFMHMAPDRARERIIDIASTQFENGGAYHQYQPLTKRGNHKLGGNFNDDPLWLILSVSQYIKESGDWSILDEQVPFNHDEYNKASLFEHLKRSFYHVVNNLGPHRLPLIGRADWNDCLNLNCFSTNPDESFQTTENKEGGVAESVMIAGLFVLYGKEFAELCKRTQRKEEAKEAMRHIGDMVSAIEKHAWDGRWFLRAYDHFGDKIGSDECEEGKIFIESQGFCIMAGVGIEDGKAQMALDSVAVLLACEYGIVLNYPAFTRYYLNMGEISTYPKGYKENAGIFCHNNPWIMIAETILGNGDRAFDYYKRICPAYLEDISDLHKTEPYVYSQMIAGKDAFRPGEAKNSWLTGTAAWNYYAITQHILGIVPDYDGLKIDPCIPASWKSLSLVRRFRGGKYLIHIDNSAGVNKGIKSITVGGKKIEGNVIEAKSPGIYEVCVIMA